MIHVCFAVVALPLAAWCIAHHDGTACAVAGAVFMLLEPMVWRV